MKGFALVLGLISRFVLVLGSVLLAVGSALSWCSTRASLPVLLLALILLVLGSSLVGVSALIVAWIVLLVLGSSALLSLFGLRSLS